MKDGGLTLHMNKPMKRFCIFPCRNMAWRWSHEPSKHTVDCRPSKWRFKQGCIRRFIYWL